MGHTANERQKYIDELKAYSKERRARESGHQRPKQADAENLTDLSPPDLRVKKTRIDLSSPKTIIAALGVFVAVFLIVVIIGGVVLGEKETSSSPVVEPKNPAVTPQTTPPPYTPPINSPPAYMPPVPTESPHRDYYLGRAQSYQRMANHELDNANHYLRQANWEMDWDGPTSMYSYYMRQYQWAMQNYAHYQKMANDYLIKAQRGW